MGVMWMGVCVCVGRGGGSEVVMNGWVRGMKGVSEFLHTVGNYPTFPLLLNSMQ